MYIELKRGGSQPLPRQISGILGERITSGLLYPGSRLPSVRELAHSLKVSQVTVSKAYRELTKRGLIQCSQGKGCFVAEDEDAGPEDSGGWQDRYDDYLPRAQLWRNFNESDAEYSFHVAALDRELLPLEAIGNTIADLVLQQPELMASYGHFQGDLELRVVMQRHLQKRGILLSPADLMITSGTQQGIDLVARTFVGPGDTVYMEAPSYTGAIDVFASRGAEIIQVPVDHDGMRMDILTRLCDERPPKLIYTNPTFQNPSGVTMSMQRRQRLLELARSYRCLLVEDDPFSDLYFREPPPPAIKSMDTEGHVVYIKSFSKILAPGCRIACVAANGDILCRLIAAKSASDLGSPLLSQRAVLPFIAERYERYAASLRSLLRERMERTGGLLTTYAPPGVTWTLPGGGLNVWLELPAALDIGRLHTLAEQEGISFLPGDVCYANGQPSQHIRLCYAQMTVPQMEQGLRLFLELLGRLIVFNGNSD